MPRPLPQDSEAMVFLKSSQAVIISSQSCSQNSPLGLLGRCALMDKGFGYKEGRRGGDARRRDEHEQGLGEGNMDRSLLASLLGFLDESPWPHILLWDLLCVEKPQQGGFAPRKLDRGGMTRPQFSSSLCPCLRARKENW